MKRTLMLGVAAAAIAVTAPNIDLQKGFPSLQPNVARADFLAPPLPPPPPPPPPPAAAKQGASQSKGGHRNATGQIVVGCIVSAAGSTIIGGAVQGNDPVDPRDMTGNEAAWKMAQGCPVFIVIAATYPPDNDGTRQVARLTDMWRKTPQGRVMTQLCARGPAADGCSNGMEVFWGEEQFAYQNGYVQEGLAQRLQLSGIQVTRQMVKLSKRPLNEKIKIAKRKPVHHRRRHHH